MGSGIFKLGQPDTVSSDNSKDPLRKKKKITHTQKPTKQNTHTHTKITCVRLSAASLEGRGKKEEWPPSLVINV